MEFVLWESVEVAGGSWKLLYASPVVSSVSRCRCITATHAVRFRRSVEDGEMGEK